jgi:hypothetical protein
VYLKDKQYAIAFSYVLSMIRSMENKHVNTLPAFELMQPPFRDELMVWVHSQSRLLELGSTSSWYRSDTMKFLMQTTENGARFFAFWRPRKTKRA